MYLECAQKLPLGETASFSFSSAIVAASRSRLCAGPDGRGGSRTLHRTGSVQGTSGAWCLVHTFGEQARLSVVRTALFSMGNTFLRECPYLCLAAPISSARLDALLELTGRGEQATAARYSRRLFRSGRLRWLLRTPLEPKAGLHIVAHWTCTNNSCRSNNGGRTI